MDIMLKDDMDGIEAACQIKELYQIPIVYLTAFGEDAVLQRVKVAEPYGYLTKPFADRDLHIAIEISIYKKQAEAALSGEELVKEIRLIRPEMPIILCTGYSTQLDEEKAKLLDINAFAFKPVAIKDIAQLIRKVMEGRAVT